jgi:hypothetical protein
MSPPSSGSKNIPSRRAARTMQQRKLEVVVLLLERNKGERAAILRV